MHFIVREKVQVKGRARAVAHLAEEIIAAEVALLLVLLQSHELDVLPETHDDLRAGGLGHVHELGELRGQREPLGFLEPGQVDRDVDVLVAVPPEGDLVKIRRRGQVGRVLYAFRPLPLHHLLGAVAHPAPVEVDVERLEEVREPVPLAWRRRRRPGLGGAVHVHLVDIGVGAICIGVCSVLILVQIVIVVHEPALNLDAVRRVEVGGKVEAVDAQAVALPGLILYRVRDPYAKSLVPLHEHMRVSILPHGALGVPYVKRPPCRHLPPSRGSVYLCAAIDRVGNVQPLARHGRVEPALVVPQLLVPRDAVAEHDLLDAVGHRLVGGLAAAALGRLARLCVRHLLLLDLRLRHRHRRVRAGGHHRACHRCGGQGRSVKVSSSCVSAREGEGEERCSGACACFVRVRLSSFAMAYDMCARVFRCE